MSDVTVQEAAYALKELERRIQNEIASFEFTNGLQVTGVTVHRLKYVSMQSADECSGSLQVAVDARLV